MNNNNNNNNRSTGDDKYFEPSVKIYDLKLLETSE